MFTTTARPMRCIAVSLLLLFLSANMPLRHTTVTNGGFEQWSGNEPSGWTKVIIGDHGELVLNRISDVHGQAVRLTATHDIDGLLAQELDATPWRGKNVVVSARVQIAPGTHAGLSLEVTRPEPAATGFRDQDGARDLKPGVWYTITKRGYVEADALTIRLGGAIASRGALDIDDVTFVEAPSTITAPTSQARDYLDQVLAFMRERHMRTHAIDWPTVIARAHRQIAGAIGPADTYWVIRGVLGTLGDHHSFLSRPKPAATTSAASATVETNEAAPMPTARLIAGQLGLIALPWLNTFGPNGATDGRRYVATARAGLIAMDEQPLCGWIVDLRDNDGGNMWPMLNAIAPLLGSGPYGAFVTPDGEADAWVMKATGITTASDSTGQRPSYVPFSLRHASLPLAVLTSADTASAAEAVTVAFAGRPQARRFGTPTAGLVSGNATKVLSDGAVLAVASVWERDRTGRDYRDWIVPEELTARNDALDAAARWLKLRCHH